MFTIFACADECDREVMLELTCPMEAGKFSKATGCKASYRHFTAYVQGMEAKGLMVNSPGC